MIKIVGHRVLVSPFKLEEVDETYKRANQAGIALLDTDEKAARQNAVDRGIVALLLKTLVENHGVKLETLSHSRNTPASTWKILTPRRSLLSLMTRILFAYLRRK